MPNIVKQANSYCQYAYAESRLYCKRYYNSLKANEGVRTESLPPIMGGAPIEKVQPAFRPDCDTLANVLPLYIVKSKIDRKQIRQIYARNGKLLYEMRPDEAGDVIVTNVATGQQLDNFGSQAGYASRDPSRKHIRKAPGFKWAPTQNTFETCDGSLYIARGSYIKRDILIYDSRDTKEPVARIRAAAGYMGAPEPKKYPIAFTTPIDWLNEDTKQPTTTHLDDFIRGWLAFERSYRRRNLYINVLLTIASSAIP